MHASSYSDYTSYEFDQSQRHKAVSVNYENYDLPIHIFRKYEI